MLSPVSTWMGDRLGTLGAVGITFYLATVSKGRWNIRLKFEFVLRGPVVKYQNVGTRFIFPRYVTFFLIGFINLKFQAFNVHLRVDIY